MKPSKAVIVEIEHCQNCHLHAWCSRHDESKYTEHRERIRSHALNVFQHCDFRINQPQNSYENINEPTSKGETKYFDHEAKTIVNFPRFGSFEIFVNGSLVFSKLQSNLWPKHDRIAVLFQKIREEIENNNTMQKYSLQYRLKNDEDQFFRQTYKKAIERNRRPSLSRPLSQNHSQVLTHGNRSPSNAMKHGNHNFISRKVHQSLKKNMNSQLLDKQEFFKPYRGQSRPITKGLKRPNTNILSRVIKNPAIQFNKQQQNFEFDSNDLRNEDEIVAKVVHNPRRRLHILKDSISKQQGTSSNHGKLSSHKQPLSLKTRVRNNTNDQESSTTDPNKKIVTGIKLPSQSHQSSIIQKNNNWTSTPIGLTPINDVSKKQTNQKPFKRVALKSDQKLKIGSSDHKTSKVIKAEDNEMQRNEQRLIAKLQQQDSKQLKSDTIELFTKKQQQPIKPQQSEKNINNNNNTSFEQKASIQLDAMQISLPNRGREQKEQKPPKAEEKLYTEEEEYEGEFNDNNVDEKSSKKDNASNNSIMRNNDIDSAPMKTQALSSKRIAHKSDQTEQLTPQNQPISTPEEQYSQDLIRDVESSDDKEEALQEEYQEDYNNQQEQPKQPSQKHQSSVKIPITNQVNSDDRKKSTSLEESFFNRPQRNHVQSIDAVKQVSMQHEYFQDEKVGEHQYGSQDLKGWSKTQNEMGYDGYSELKMAQRKQSDIVGVSVQNERTTKTLISNIKQDQQAQEEKYYEQEQVNEEVYKVEQAQFKQPHRIEQQQNQQKLSSTPPHQTIQQPENYAQQFAQQQIQQQQQQQQRPQSRNSRSHHSSRMKTPSQGSHKNIVRQSQKLSLQKQDERDFTKKQFHVEQSDKRERSQQQEEKMMVDGDEKHGQQLHKEQYLIHNDDHHQEQQQVNNTHNEKEQLQNEQNEHNTQHQHQDQQAQQQQLSDIEQSHQSIPIIVSTTHGTSRIIQQQVSQGLQQIYNKQQRERQEREEILQKMIHNDNHHQLQDENHLQQLKPIEQIKPKQTQNYDDYSQEEVVADNTDNIIKQQQQHQQQQQQTPNHLQQQNGVEQQQPQQQQQVNEEQQKNDEYQVQNTPKVPEGLMDGDVSHQQQEHHHEHEQHTVQDHQNVAQQKEQATQHEKVDESVSKHPVEQESALNSQINANIQQDNTNNVIDNNNEQIHVEQQQKQQAQNNPAQQQAYSHEGDRQEQAATVVALPTNHSLAAREYMENLQSTITDDNHDNVAVVNTVQQQAHEQQLVDEQQKTHEQVVGESLLKQQPVEQLKEQLSNVKQQQCQQQQHQSNDQCEQQQQHVQNKVQQNVNPVVQQVVDKVEEQQQVAQVKQQQSLQVKQQQLVQLKQQEEVVKLQQLQSVQIIKSSVLQNPHQQQQLNQQQQQLSQKPLQASVHNQEQLQLQGENDKQQQQKAHDQSSLQEQVTPQHQHQQQNQLPVQKQTPNNEQKIQQANNNSQQQHYQQQQQQQHQQHHQSHSQQEKLQQQQQVAKDAMIIDHEIVTEKNVEQEVAILQQQQQEVQQQQTHGDAHHEEQQPTGEKNDLQKEGQQQQQQQQEKDKDKDKEQDHSKQAEQNKITAQIEHQSHQAPILHEQSQQQVNHQPQNTLQHEETQKNVQPHQQPQQGVQQPTAITTKQHQQQLLQQTQQNHHAQQEEAETQNHLQKQAQNPMQQQQPSSSKAIESQPHQQPHNDHNNIQPEKEHAQSPQQPQTLLPHEDNHHLQGNESQSTPVQKLEVPLEQNHKDGHQSTTNNQVQQYIQNQHSLQLNNQNSNRSPETTQKIIKNEIQTLNDKIAQNHHQENHNNQSTPSLKKLAPAETNQKIVDSLTILKNQKLAQEDIHSLNKLPSSKQIHD